MDPLPAKDLRSNVGTYAVPAYCLPAIAYEMVNRLPLEQFDPSFVGQYLQTTYFDTKDFALTKARKSGKGRYLTLRIRSYDQDSYALSAKTENQKFRVEVDESLAKMILQAGLGIEGLLPADLQARLLELSGGLPLAPVVTIFFQRYAVEDDVHRLTLDCNISTDTGKCFPSSVLEQKSTDRDALPLIAYPLRPLKLSKFLWAMS